MDVTVWGDLKMHCYPRSNSASKLFYFTERSDPAEMRLIEALVLPQDVVVDVGANIGSYTLLLAKLVGRDGRVLAIEPDPVAVRRLRENVTLNNLDQVEIAPVAVGSRAGVGQITTDADVSNTLTVGPGTERIQDIEIATLDDLLGGRAPSFVKIDVEGFEGEVLRGAEAALAARPILQIEIIEHLLRRMESSPAHIHAQLSDSDYRVARPFLQDGRVTLALDTNGTRDGNVVAVPAERWQEILSRL